ncbi:hypothetical protein BKA64DRAFT_64426 [Cadophora sp. MPI-SDFR-AT-0126]|nr:hypothetical protein BKA64DRAFT_64426 [Leotiomycetes sp. MPI-SDFR-AT-0126]
MRDSEHAVLGLPLLWLLIIPLVPLALALAHGRSHLPQLTDKRRQDEQGSQAALIRHNLKFPTPLRLAHKYDLYHRNPYRLRPSGHDRSPRDITVEPAPIC